MLPKQAKNAIALLMDDSVSPVKYKVCASSNQVDLQDAGPPDYNSSHFSVHNSMKESAAC